MSDIAISVEGLGKRYRLGVQEDRHDTLLDTISAALRSPLSNFRRLKRLSRFAEVDTPDVLWALRDISFQVKRGEVVGIIGRNGAGKSTLLKILSRITEPTIGRVVLEGRVSSLLEVGTGFHPELSGRENVFLNGTILGMSRREVERKFEEIVEFSGIEKFIDTPVKRYSSGMKVRLAFAVAAHLEPEILVIDEVLAVGDAEFQKKCLGKMEDVARGGRTVLFVSHDLGAVQKLCPRSILLRYGGLAMDGATQSVMQEYLSALNRTDVDAFSADNPERRSTGELTLTGGYVADGAGRSTTELIAGLPAEFVFLYSNRAAAAVASLGFTIINQSGVAVTHCHTALNGFEFTDLGESGRFACGIQRLPLPPGRYRVAVAVSADGVQTDLVPNAIIFDVVASVFFGTPRTPPLQYCAALTEHDWKHRAEIEPAAAVRQAQAVLRG
jgi:lipopolysaccharide transport system ATP-binding protein